MIPYGQHCIDEDDIEAVNKVLRSEMLTQGPEIEKFESAVANYVGAKYAVAVSSCTAGLHIAAVASGISNGDTILTSPISFVASANIASYTNSKIDFVDVDASTVNISPESLSATLQDKPECKLVVPVHFGGLACDMDAISKLCKEKGIKIIEDAAHALGAKYSDGSMVGSCKHSLMTVFSFHPVKIIASGEGGMITTNDEATYRKLIRLRSHGINKLDDFPMNKELAYTLERKNPWFYEMRELGFNYRMTDIQAALGRSQLKKIESYLKRRREIVKRYKQDLKDVPSLSFAQTDNACFSANHLFVIKLNFQSLKYSRAELMDLMRERGVITQVHYIPIPLHPYYKELGYEVSGIQNAMDYYNEALSIPIFYGLNDSDQSLVIDLLKDLIV